MRALFVSILMLAASTMLAFAVEPGEALDDPALEARARALSTELRCLVCQNQSIDDSNAELARDLRILVRERLVAGDTDAEVLDYVVERYGEFVLLKPVFGRHTLILWFAAPILFATGLVAIFITLRRRRKSRPGRPAPLTADERSRLDALLSEPEH